MQRIHGGDIYSFDKDVLDFSINTNPLGIRHEIRAAAISAISDMDKYPDRRQMKLRTAIGSMENVDPEHVICGNGASEIIFALVSALKPKKTLLLSPSFTEYEVAADTVETEKAFYLLDEKDDFEVREDILSYIRPDIDMFFLCNPNNPTGRLIEKDLMKKILEKCRENSVCLVIDESFMEFSGRYKECTMVEEVEKYDDLMILKSFTKMYSFPGLRLGYALCRDREILEKLERVRPPWAVSNIAESAGVAACSLKTHPENTRKYINREKKKICFKLSCLEEKGLKYIESEADFILFTAPDVNGENLYDLLLKKKILIRRCGDFRGLSGSWYRISVNDDASNEKLTQALKEIYS
ncbi:MAG: aminotransferase class I/II-fold pyridoxal phosphate-dependent enzyme [Lachnospiraceae bacterium]|nr:aminotransferase class I/II-fold pyridoxal phosphate-dependent enzyme [Lachnospiraceae bacterium]